MGEDPPAPLPVRGPSSGNPRCFWLPQLCCCDLAWSLCPWGLIGLKTNKFFTNVLVGFQEGEKVDTQPRHAQAGTWGRAQQRSKYAEGGGRGPGCSGNQEEAVWLEL